MSHRHKQAASTRAANAAARRAMVAEYVRKLTERPREPVRTEWAVAQAAKHFCLAESTVYRYLRTQPTTQTPPNNGN